MARYSLRDGKIAANKISITGKLMVTDRFENALASTGVVVASANQATGTVLTIALQPDCPRAIKICNAGQAQFGSTRNFRVVGYNALGDYTTEVITAPIGTSGVVRSNNAFAYIGSIAPIQDRAVSNYGTFAITLTDKFGLSHPISSKKDIKSETRYQLVGSGFGSPTPTSTLVGSVSNKYINLTYNTIVAKTGNVGSASVIRYLSEFQ